MTTPPPDHLRSLIGLAAVLTLGFVGARSVPPDPATVPVDREVVYYDFIDDRGQLDGGAQVMAKRELPGPEAVIPAHFVTLHGGAASSTSRAMGNSANRVDIVFVGDGYTAAELPAFHASVDEIVVRLFEHEPFGRYEDVIAIHRVDVVSNESGVDNDPVEGIDRDTELDMGYWCGGTQRALCVNIGKAYNYAQNAPDVDQVVALANSRKYGGAAYPSSNLSTSAGDYVLTPDIVMHELGHALGKLADEYSTGGPTDWPGGEPSAQNVSTLDADSMRGQGAKWATWLGSSTSGFQGTIGTYEGANYSQNGIYRPSSDSLMRSLLRPFNLVGAEQVIKQIYLEVSPIESASDPDEDYTSDDVLVVTPITLGGAALPVRWEVDGVPVAGQTSGTLDLATLGLGPCAFTVTATVVDDTPWVRDLAFRADRMTETIVYTVNREWTRPGCAGAPNSTGNTATSYLLGSPSIAAEDLVLGAYGGPPGAPVLFFYGDTEIASPLGQGTLCAGGNQQRVAVSVFDPLGVASYAVDWQNDPVDLPGTALQPGTTWIFQGWYRDVDPAGIPSFNFSGAAEATFCP